MGHRLPPFEGEPLRENFVMGTTEFIGPVLAPRSREPDEILILNFRSVRDLSQDPPHAGEMIRLDIPEFEFVEEFALRLACPLKSGPP